VPPNQAEENENRWRGERESEVKAREHDGSRNAMVFDVGTITPVERRLVLGHRVVYSGQVLPAT